MAEDDRQILRWFRDINEEMVCEGDKVAIGVKEYGSGGLRIGYVVKDGISGEFFRNQWQNIRVKVRVTGGAYGAPYTKTYEYPHRMIKLGTEDD